MPSACSGWDIVFLVSQASCISIWPRITMGLLRKQHANLSFLIKTFLQKTLGFSHKYYLYATARQGSPQCGSLFCPMLQFHFYFSNKGDQKLLFSIQKVQLIKRHKLQAFNFWNLDWPKKLFSFLSKWDFCPVFSVELEIFYFSHDKHWLLCRWVNHKISLEQDFFYIFFSKYLTKIFFNYPKSFKPVVLN